MGGRLRYQLARIVIYRTQQTRFDKLALVVGVLAAVLLSACAQGTTASSSTSSVTAVVGGRRPAVDRGTTKHHRRAIPAKRRGGPGTLAVSSANPDIVQAQPRPGSCHAVGSGFFSEPDPHCTPGALNPDVTEHTVGQTICRRGWTKTVRPPESVTEREKVASMAAYGDTGAIGGYEYDHLVSLELGGATNDARNLWPEPGASPNPKDSVESDLHQLVCDGQMPLAEAQHIIATGWVAWARRHTTRVSSRLS